MKKLKLLLLTIVLPALAVSVWGFITLSDHRPNGFSRKFVNGIKLINEVKYYSHFSGIAGMTDHSIYLKGNTPHLIYAVNTDLGNLKSIVITNGTNSRLSSNFDIEVDSPNYRLYAGNLLSVQTGDLNNKEQEKRVLSTKFYTNATMLPSGSFLIRPYEHAVKDFILKKTDKNGIAMATEKHPILKHDMGFSTQATLLYNKRKHQVILIYKLLNKIVCLDTNLNTVYVASTLDTIQSTNLNYTVTKHGRSKTGTIVSAPRYTNYRSCLDDDNLYVYSMLKADNEPFPNAPAIDVYSAVDGSYRYSFKLPNSDGKKLSDFKVRNRKLIAVYKTLGVVKCYQLHKIKS